MDFISKLDPQQQEVALKVATKAQEMGIDPRLAVAIAYRESGLRVPDKPGGAGEIGIMQVKPATAKMIGFDPDELKNPDRNIEIGLTYLKQGLERYNSPVLAAAGYNAGYDHPYFSDPDKGLPKSTESYLEGIRDLGGFTATPRREEAAPPEAEAPADVGVEQAERPPMPEGARTVANIIGGAAGVGAAGAAQRYLKPTPSVSAPSAPGMPPSGAPMAGPAGRMPMAGPVAGGPAGPVSAGPVSAAPAGPVGPAAAQQLGTPGTYGRGVGPGQMTFNYARAAGLPEIEAAKALGMGSQPGEVHDLLGRRREALTAIQQRFPTESYVENPRYGGIMTPDQGAGRGPRASFTTQAPGPVAPGQPAPPAGALRQIPTPIPVPTTPPPPGALERVLGGARTAGAAGMDVGARLLSNPVVAGAAGGASAVDALQQYYARRESDPIGAYLAAASGVVGGAAMLPLPAPVRATAAVAAPLSLYLYDKFRPYQSVLERPMQ